MEEEIIKVKMFDYFGIQTIKVSYTSAIDKEFAINGNFTCAPISRQKNRIVNAYDNVGSLVVSIWEQSEDGVYRFKADIDTSKNWDYLVSNSMKFADSERKKWFQLYVRTGENHYKENTIFTSDKLIENDSLVLSMLLLLSVKDIDGNVLKNPIILHELKSNGGKKDRPDLVEKLLIISGKK
ncbi:MAG: hypothetical protein WDK96_00735 [Candidatus Paceibacterota bacterium]|jgi:hypothetical protein